MLLTEKIANYVQKGRFSKDSSLEQRIINYFSKNPNPAEKTFQQIADVLGVNKDKIESTCYTLLNDFYGFGKSNESKGAVDLTQVLKGAKVEMEHTRNFQVASKIARDHVAESKTWRNKDYYGGLSAWEKMMKQGTFRY